MVLHKIKMKKIINKNLYLIWIILVWSLFHITFWWLNEILKNADCFAYLQMSYHFKALSLEWFWTWWFWFLYSLLISIFDTLTFSINEYYAVLSLNIILFWVSALILYKIWEKYLWKKFNLLLVVLFYLSSILLHFNIWVLSENIYIPLFLGLVLFLIKKIWNGFNKSLNLFIISLFLALLYFTRAEAFIYIGSIIMILFFIEAKNYKFQIKKYKLWVNFIKKSLLIIFSFFLIISPYLVYLNSITWDWWLTNKWSSNLRQAELRWSEKMDDEWFEQAVWELTSDNHHLKSGFVWGLKYDKGEKTKWIKNYLLDNPKDTTFRIINNQIKLYSRNLPEMIISDSIKLYQRSWLFIPMLMIPLLLVLYWFYAMISKKEYDFLTIFVSFFLVASLFFTLFFVLNRYFLIFLPLFLVFLVYWIENLKTKKVFKNMIIILVLWIYLAWNYVYYNWVNTEDYKYEVKRYAWEFLNNYIKDKSKLSSTKIMERFPIVTYYSGTKERWITPYTNNLDNLIEYAKFNKIDYLVVDTLDFKTYRPKLDFLLNEDYQNKSLHKIITIQVNNEKVILYKFTF